MAAAEEIKIPLKKSKILLMGFGCLVFVALGILLLFAPLHTDNPFMNNSVRKMIVGSLSVIFFGYIGIGAFRKMFDRDAGLTFSEKGFLNNSGGFQKQFVQWADVTGFNTGKVQRQVFLNIEVRNPEDYIKGERSFLKRKMMKMNLNHQGSVISISANSLDCTFPELNAMVMKAYSDYKNRASAKQ
ncbi:MAG: STM3941 family protein [Bacteroidia bacterium]